MSERTMRLEIGVAEDAQARDRFWLQVRYSDGEVRPIGRLFDSQADLLDDLIDTLGNTYGAEHAIVRASRIPASATDLLN